LLEKKILKYNAHPNLIKLHYSFQTSTDIYFLINYLSGGELFEILHRDGVKPITENDAKFYAACVILALDYLHQFGILYRDLKPENIIIDSDGYANLIDYGLSNELRFRPKSICGTIEYLSPGMFRDKSYDTSVDWWMFGCLIYEMLVLKPPF
jgi:serine/threonine protein kinase